MTYCIICILSVSKTSAFKIGFKEENHDQHCQRLLDIRRNDRYNHARWKWQDIDEFKNENNDERQEYDHDDDEVVMVTISTLM